MGGLHDHHRFKAMLPDAGLFDHLDQSLEAVQSTLLNEKLPRIGPAFLHHRHRFNPNQPHPTFRKALVAALCQSIGAAVPSAVATLHRLNRHGVGESLSLNRERLLKPIQLGRQGERHAYRVHLLLQRV